MPQWFEQLPEDDSRVSYEQRLANIALLDEVRRNAHAYFSTQYEADPDRYTEAAVRSEQLAKAVCWDLEEDFSHPAIPVIRGAFERLIFTFTNPVVREDMVDDISLIELIADLCNQQSPSESDINLQALAHQFDMRSIHIYFCYQHLCSENILQEGVNMNQRFVITRDYTPLYFDETSEDGHS